MSSGISMKDGISHVCSLQAILGVIVVSNICVKSSKFGFGFIFSSSCSTGGCERECDLFFQRYLTNLTRTLRNWLFLAQRLFFGFLAYLT